MYLCDCVSNYHAFFVIQYRMVVALLLSLLVAGLELTTALVINATNFDNIHAYIVTNSQLHLEPGNYYLTRSLVFDNVEDVKLTGVNC